MSASVMCGHEAEGYCFFRSGKNCLTLVSTSFGDGKCHFRKKYPEGPNLYDKAKKRERENETLR